MVGDHMSNKKNSENKNLNNKKKTHKKINKSTINEKNSKQTTKNTKVINSTKKVTNKKEKALDHTCPNCRAPLFFVPSLGKWKCNHCSGEFSLQDLQKFNNASSIEHNKEEIVNTRTVDDAIEDLYVSYKCKNCGAEIIADNHTSATFCVYCGNVAILKSKLSGEFKPDWIIPFKKEKEDAIEAFKSLSEGRPFLPKDFNDVVNIEKIRGIYIPFWVYDLTIEGAIEARGQIVSHWRIGDTHYTKTDYYKMIRQGSGKFSRIPINGSSRFSNDIMGSIEPFNYHNMVPYNHAYLSGFFAERYDVDGDILVGNAVTRAVESMKQIFLNDMVGYSNKNVYNNTLRSSEIKKQYALFPVWMVNVKYKDKYYLFAMNGQTGKFIGNMPVDVPKVIKWFICIFLGLFVFMIVGAFILFKSGVFL